MSPFKSTRLAWSVAVAALALWATSAPISWGQAASGAARLFDLPTDDTTTTTTTLVVDDEAVAQATACIPVPPAIAQVVQTPVVPVVPAAPAVTSADSGTFHLCGPDTQAAQDIERLIAGRGFSATLSARGDGCADLTIRATSGVNSGSSTSNLSVSLGSGHNLSIKITSQGGATSVSIG
jgi:hypothetical protein